MNESSIGRAVESLTGLEDETSSWATVAAAAASCETVLVSANILFGLMCFCGVSLCGSVLYCMLTVNDCNEREREREGKTL